MAWTRGMIVAAAAALGWTGQAVAQATQGSTSAGSPQQMRSGQEQGNQPPGFREQLKEAVDAHATAAKRQIDNLRVVQLTVRNVDPAKNKVTFDAKVSPSASFQSGQDQIAIDQLKPGEQVRAAFDPATGDVVAVEVITPGGQSSSSGSATSNDMSQGRGAATNHGGSGSAESGSTQ